MRDTHKTVEEKLTIAIKATNCGNIKATTRKDSCAPNQIRRWIKMIGELRDAVDRNPRARSLNKGSPVAKKAVEGEIYERIINLRKKDTPVTTLLIITKALGLDGAFHGGSISALWSWVCPFLAHRSLSIRRVIREGQKPSGHLESVRRYSADCVAERFATDDTFSRVSGGDFVNMDETAVFFETKSTKQSTRKERERSRSVASALTPSE